MKRILSLLITCVLVACGDTTNNKMIIGTWEATEWLVNGTPAPSYTENTSFTFGEDGKYVYRHRNQEEKGTYKVENDMLFTKPDGELEMMVRITKLTADSMRFYMERGERPEELTLLRKK